jgi:hypothetical protein
MRRLLLGVVFFAALLPATGAAPDVQPAPRSKSVAQTLAALPPAARSLVSRTIGHDQAAFRARRSPDGVAFRNAAQGLRAAFSKHGMSVDAAGVRFTLALRAYGGASLGPVAPRVDGNRISYRRGLVTEWYANGPLGVEQGFTLAAPPRGLRGGDVILALDLASSRPASVLPTGRGLRFSGSSLRYQGLMANDAVGRPLPTRLELDGHRLLLRVRTANARFPVVVDPFVQQAKLVARPAGSYLFSIDESYDDRTIVAGAEDESVNGKSGQGAVYVFNAPTGAWANGTQVARLTASDGAAGDGLGESVAIDATGTTIVAGAPFAKLGTAYDKGAVYVFVKPGGGWVNGTQTAKLTAHPDAQAPTLASLGWSVAIDGDSVVAGAPYWGEGGAIFSRGAVFLFVKPGGGWANASETIRFTPADSVNDTYVGWSVGISGNTIVTGAAGATVGGQYAHGAVYVFVNSGGGWTIAAKLTASDGAGLDFLGDQVGVFGDTIVATAPKADIGGHADQGAAYVFVKPAGPWVDSTQTAKLTQSDGAAGGSFGDYSADIGSDTIVIGRYVFVHPAGGWANGTETAKLVTSGSIAAIADNEIVTSGFTVQVYYRSGAWNTTAAATLTPSEGAANDELGYSVAISGDTIVVGAPYADVGSHTDQGFAYVADKPAGGWTQLTNVARLTSSDGAANDLFGISVAVSGSTVVVGAPGVGSGDWGAVYVFARPAGGWADATQSAELGTLGSGWLGYSVGISGDTIAAGAPATTSGTVNGGGAAFVFVKPGASWADSYTPQAQFLASDASEFDALGWAIGIDGGTVAVGTRYTNAVYVYSKPAGNWVGAFETAKLTASSGGVGLGTTLGVSGNVIVAGAPLDTVNGHIDQGSAFVFVRPGATWSNETQQARLTASDGVANDRLGTSVSISGDTIAAGALYAPFDAGPHNQQGAAYVFNKPAGGWADGTQAAKLVASDGSVNDELAPVGVSGSTVVAGAPLADVNGKTDQGAAYVFVNAQPTAVGLTSLTAHREAVGVVVRWRATGDPRTLGFNIYRGGRRLNRALIRSIAARAYRFLDPRAPGHARYRLEAVQIDGQSSWYGPAAA